MITVPAFGRCGSAVGGAKPTFSDPTSHTKGILALAQLLRGWSADDEMAVEAGMQILFQAGMYELTKPTREKLKVLLSIISPDVTVPFDGEVM